MRVDRRSDAVVWLNEVAILSRSRNWLDGVAGAGSAMLSLEVHSFGATLSKHLVFKDSTNAECRKLRSNRTFSVGQLIRVIKIHISW